MKTTSRLPSGVNEDFIKNLVWQHQQQQHQKISTNNNKISSNSHQVFQNIHRKRSVLKSLFDKVPGLSLQLYQKRVSEHVFSLITSGRLLLEEPKSLMIFLKVVINHLLYSSFAFWDQLTVDSWSFSEKLTINVLFVLEFSLSLELYWMLSLAFHIAN